MRSISEIFTQFKSNMRFDFLLFSIHLHTTHTSLKFSYFTENTSWNIRCIAFHILTKGEIQWTQLTENYFLPLLFVWLKCEHTSIVIALQWKIEKIKNRLKLHCAHVEICCHWKLHWIVIMQNSDRISSKKKISLIFFVLNKV